ncbi:MAG: VWA domain-containing protein [Saprospiraceae bacterium]|nr:VWA domain-containing protein [Saprospiraceae bacterium]
MTFRSSFPIVLILLFACSCAVEDDFSLSANEDYDPSFNNTSPNGVGSTSQATGENYLGYEENPFVSVDQEPISTFSIDADGGSYSNMRRFISQDKLPPQSSVRTEEFINYFSMDYPAVEGGHPIGLHGEISSCPWKQDNKLIRIGIKGKDIPETELPPSNIVLLIDVSGSMSSENKLPLLQEGFSLLVDEFSDEDRIAIVTYAGNAGVALESTPGWEKEKIKEAISGLSSGGSTAGAQGIITAYEIAEANFIPGGNNRIIIGTDGDFNVGLSSVEEIVDLIEEKRELGVFLTTLGVGGGNYNEAILEQLADNGNGTYEYIDNIEQAKKVFIHEFSKFYTVAKDVKVQIEFNPQLVKEYRLIGYENRLLETEDFEDDTKDAGEIGAGQNITALYEIVPNVVPGTDGFASFHIDFRYKLPDSESSQLIFHSVFDYGIPFEFSSENHRFLVSVAGYSLLLLDSEYKGELTYSQIEGWLNHQNLDDPLGLKDQFKQLLLRASTL